MIHHPYTQHLLGQAIRFSKMNYKNTGKAFPPWEFSLSDMSVFFLLQQARITTGKPQTRMSDISSQLNISRPAATQCVAKLCRRGLLERFRDPNDKRSILIRPTPKAEDIVYKEMERALTLTDQVIYKMGEQDAAELIRLLDRLHNLILIQIQEEENT